MKRQGPDPILYVVLALVIITLLSVFAAFAGRGCAQSMTQSATGDYGKPAYEQSREFFDSAPKISPEAYSEFVKTLEGIDLGMGVHVGQSVAELKTALGSPDSVTRTSGGRQAYSYTFPPDAKGPFPDQRHRGGVTAIFHATMLMVTVKEEAVQEIWIGISPFEEKSGGWKFITLNGKPLSECKADDLKSFLGEPNFAEGRTVMAWRYAPDSAKGMLTRQSAYVQASFIRKGGLLEDLLIGVTSTPLPPPATITGKPEPAPAPPEPLLKSKSSEGNK